MEIKTKEFSMSNQDYFKIIYFDGLKRLALGFVLMIIGAIYAYTLELTIIVIIVFCIVTLRYWKYAYSKKNTFYFKKRYMIITDDMLSSYLDDGSSQHIKWANMIRTIKRHKYYLVLLAKYSFIYIPVSAFNTPEDVQGFEELIKNGQKQIRIR